MASWSDEYILTTYDLAKNGHTQTAIAKALGVTPATFTNWKRKHPELRRALRKGGAWRKGQNTFTITDYVTERLPTKLKALWEEINKSEYERNGVAKLEALLDKHGKTARQWLFLHALMCNSFNVTRACRLVNISRQTVVVWKEEDPDFAALVAEIDEIKKDFFEEHLCKLVASGDSPATIFANRTKNKDRGYGEKIEHEHAGQITHGVVSIEGLNLPLRIRKQILNAMRKKVESKDITGDDYEYRRTKTALLEGSGEE